MSLFSLTGESEGEDAVIEEARSRERITGV